MSLENFVDVIVILIRITFAVGIISGILKVVSTLMKDKFKE